MHAIYGKIELHNGLVLTWLEFVKCPSREEAETKAIAIKQGQWKGVTTRCWIE